MHVLKTNINGNPNVGLFGYCTNDYCLLGMEVKKKIADEIGKVLHVPVHRLNIAGTSLLGVFLAGNSKKLLVPSICFDDELKTLQKLDIDYEVIESNVTALGNTILCNDSGCLVSQEFSSNQKKRIREALNVPLKPGTIGDLDTVGSLSALNSHACIISRDITDEELEKVEDLIKIKCFPSSVNMGSPYTGSGLLCNDKGFVIGDQSGGPEMTNVDESLGFLKGH